LQLHGQDEWIEHMLFASIFVPDFPLQALFAGQPELRPHAIALVDGTPPLLRVVAANDKALLAGAAVGMLKAQAESIGVKVIMRSRHIEESAHAAVITCARRFSPRIQDKAIDLVVLDIDGLQGLFGLPEEIASKIRLSLLDERLAVHIGIAGNPDTATIAAHGFRGSFIVTKPEQIGKLPVSLLSPSEKLLETLELWGITTLSKLAALDAGKLSQRLGQEGIILQRLARGQQVHPFIADVEETEFKERTELEYSLDLLDSLYFVFTSLLERICASLEEHALATNEVDYELTLDPPCVGGVIVPENQQVHRRTLKFSEPSTDRKLLLKRIHVDLQSHPPNAPIRAVSVSAHAVPPRQIQLGLFAPDSPNPDKIDLVIARLFNLAGEHRVGSFEILDSNRPRAFVMGRFEPDRRPDPVQPALLSQTKVGLRLFEPVKRANIRLRSDIPLHISFDGKGGEVIEHSSPWLASGEWWNDMAYSRKEWDVEVHFNDGTRGKFLIFVDLRTRQSFVEGSYD
jgi:protein ImuB